MNEDGLFSDRYFYVHLLECNELLRHPIFQLAQQELRDVLEVVVLPQCWVELNVHDRLTNPLQVGALGASTVVEESCLGNEALAGGLEEAWYREVGPLDLDDGLHLDYYFAVELEYDIKHGLVLDVIA